MTSNQQRFIDRIIHWTPRLIQAVIGGNSMSEIIVRKSMVNGKSIVLKLVAEHEIHGEPSSHNHGSVAKQTSD